MPFRTPEPGGGDGGERVRLLYEGGGRGYHSPALERYLPNRNVKNMCFFVFLVCTCNIKKRRFHTQTALSPPSETKRLLKCHKMPQQCPNTNTPEPAMCCVPCAGTPQPQAPIPLWRRGKEPWIQSGVARHGVVFGDGGHWHSCAAVPLSRAAPPPLIAVGD